MIPNQTWSLNGTKRGGKKDQEKALKQVQRKSNFKKEKDSF